MSQQPPYYQQQPQQQPPYPQQPQQQYMAPAPQVVIVNQTVEDDSCTGAFWTSCVISTCTSPIIGLLALACFNKTERQRIGVGAGIGTGSSILGVILLIIAAVIKNGCTYVCEESYKTTTTTTLFGTTATTTNPFATTNAENLKSCLNACGIAVSPVNAIGGILLGIGLLAVVICGGMLYMRNKRGDAPKGGVVMNQQYVQPTAPRV